jgi:hypothetical protein
MNGFAILVYFVPRLTDVNVGFLADANLAENLAHMPTLHEYFDRQIIIALVSKRVATVVFACMENQLVLKEQSNDVEAIASLELC